MCQRLVSLSDSVNRKVNMEGSSWWEAELVFFLLSGTRYPWAPCWSAPRPPREFILCSLADWVEQGPRKSRALIDKLVRGCSRVSLGTARVNSFKAEFPRTRSFPQCCSLLRKPTDFQVLLFFLHHTKIWVVRAGVCAEGHPYCVSR